MKRKLLTIAIFLSTYAFGQDAKETIYLNALGLTIIDSISTKVIVGQIYTSDGFAGFTIQFNSNNTFEKTNFTCIGSSTLDSGSWTIQNKNTLVLNSKTQTFYYDVVKFDNFYFFILEAERQKFIDALQSTRAMLKNGKAIKIDNQKHSENYLTWYLLKQTYFTREIETNTGT